MLDTLSNFLAFFIASFLVPLAFIFCHFDFDKKAELREPIESFIDSFLAPKDNMLRMLPWIICLPLLSAITYQILVWHVSHNTSDFELIVYIFFFTTTPIVAMLFTFHKTFLHILDAFISFSNQVFGVFKTKDKIEKFGNLITCYAAILAYFVAGFKVPQYINYFLGGFIIFATIICLFVFIKEPTKKT